MLPSDCTLRWDIASLPLEHIQTKQMAMSCTCVSFRHGAAEQRCSQMPLGPAVDTSDGARIVEMLHAAKPTRGGPLVHEQTTRWREGPWPHSQPAAVTGSLRQARSSTSNAQKASEKRACSTHRNDAGCAVRSHRVSAFLCKAADSGHSY